MNTKAYTKNQKLIQNAYYDKKSHAFSTALIKSSLPYQIQEEQRQTNIAFIKKQMKLKNPANPIRCKSRSTENSFCFIKSRSSIDNQYHQHEQSLNDKSNYIERKSISIHTQNPKSISIKQNKIQSQTNMIQILNQNMLEKSPKKIINYSNSKSPLSNKKHKSEEKISTFRKSSVSKTPDPKIITFNEVLDHKLNENKHPVNIETNTRKLIKSKTSVIGAQNRQISRKTESHADHKHRESYCHKPTNSSRIHSENVSLIYSGNHTPTTQDESSIGYIKTDVFNKDAMLNELNKKKPKAFFGNNTSNIFNTQLLRRNTTHLEQTTPIFNNACNFNQENSRLNFGNMNTPFQSDRNHIHDFKDTGYNKQSQASHLIHNQHPINHLVYSHYDGTSQLTNLDNQKITRDNINRFDLAPNTKKAEILDTQLQKQLKKEQLKLEFTSRYSPELVLDIVSSPFESRDKSQNFLNIWNFEDSLNISKTRGDDESQYQNNRKYDLKKRHYSNMILESKQSKFEERNFQDKLYNYILDNCNDKENEHIDYFN